MQVPASKRRKALQDLEDSYDHNEGGGRVSTHDSSSNSSLLLYLFEIFIAFVFWSGFAEAIPALWYIPMDKMAISGVEPLLLTTASMGLLAFAPVRELIWRNPMVHLLGAICLASFHIGDLLISGSMTMVSSCFHSLIIVGELIHPDPKLRDRRVYTLMLGLIALVYVRFGLSSVSPLFLYSPVNILCIALTIAVCIYLKNHRQKSITLPQHQPVSPQQPTSALTDMGTGLGFGLFLVLNTMFLTEHGVLARWDDAHPFPIGLGMIASMVFGISISKQPFVKTWAWFIMAVVSTLVFILLPTPVGAISGYGLIIYLSSIWHNVADEISKIVHLGKAFTLAGSAYTIFTIGTVWCIAYNFVPGGFYVREATPQLVLICLAASKLCWRVHSPAQAKTKPTESNNYRLFLIGLLIITVLLFAPAFIKRSMSYQNYDAQGLDKSNLRGMIWATHFGYDNFGRPSYEAMLKMIQGSGANVIGLVETDIMRLFNGNRDITEWLEEKMHLYADYGPGTNNHTWGCALLSAFPIKRADKVKLPSPEGENACLIDATLDVNGKDIDVIVAHFGNTEHVLDRKLQTEDTYQRLKERVDANKPVVWLGYFTAPPGSPNYNRVMQSGVLDSTDSKDRYCEYIWYKNMVMKRFARIPKGDVSDTEIQLVEFQPLS